MKFDTIPEQVRPTALSSSVFVPSTATPGGTRGSWLLLCARVAELVRSRAALAEFAASRRAQATLDEALQLAHPTLFLDPATVSRPPGLILSSMVPTRPLFGPLAPPDLFTVAQARPGTPRLPLDVATQAGEVHRGQI